jgi:hypothetical protein
MVANTAIPVGCSAEKATPRKKAPVGAFLKILII